MGPKEVFNKYFKKYNLNNKLYLQLALLGIILALILTFSVPFKDRILSRLFPKPASEAAKPIKPTPTTTPTPTPTPTSGASASIPGPKINKFVAKVKNVKANEVTVTTPTGDITIPTDTNTSYKAWVYTQGPTNPPKLQSSSKSDLKNNQRVNVEKIEVTDQPIKYEIIIY